MPDTEAATDETPPRRVRVWRWIVTHLAAILIVGLISLFPALIVLAIIALLNR